MEVTVPPNCAAVAVMLLASAVLTVGALEATVEKLALVGAHAEPPEFSAKALK